MPVAAASRPRSSLPPAVGRLAAAWSALAFGAVAVFGAAGAAAVGGLAEQSLQPRSSEGRRLLFTKLAAEETGIMVSNAYDDPRMWRERYHEFGVGAIGTGVAIGDFDRDGRADVFVVSKLETCRLFRNLGDWKFEDVTEKSGVLDGSGEWKQGAAFVDINNDGWLDLYLCRFAAPNLLFVNQGDGSFREEAEVRGLAVVDASSMAAFEDYDRDGWLDVYLQTNLLSANGSPEGQRDYLFRNRGDGTFEDVTATAGIAGLTQGHSATWWDYDEDGWPDIYIANDFRAPDFLYRNRGDGTFVDVIGEVVPHMPFSSMGADSGDVDNDGHVDFLVADMAATTHEKDQRGMADSRSNLAETEAGQPDVAIQLTRNALYLNTGLGRCLETAYLSGVHATDWTWSIRFEDLDNDGRVDLHVTNGMNREQHNVDLVQSILRSETALQRVRLMRSAPVFEEPNLAYRNAGDLRFEEVGAEWGLDERGVSFGASFGDLDNDGDLDLVYTNYGKGASVLRNDSVGGNRALVELEGVVSNRFGIGAVVEIQTAAGSQMRRLSSARGYLSTSEPAVHFGLGEDELIERLVVTWPSGRTQEFRNLEANRAYTITEPDSAAASDTSGSARREPQFQEAAAELGLAVTAAEERLEGTVDQPLLATRFNRRGPAVAVTDLTGDGAEEIVVGGTTQEAALILGKRGGTYQQIPGGGALRPWPVNDGPPLAVDLSGDSLPDLLLTSGGAVFAAEEPEYQMRLLINAGAGSLRPAPDGSLPPLATSAGGAVAADFDRDGRLEVFVGGRVAPGYFPETPYSALLVNRGGRLVDVTDVIAPELREVGMVTSALWSDVDGDGWVDLLLALDWGAVRYFRNAQGKGFQDLSEQAGFAAAGSGWWTALASCDFNNDGIFDFAVGNVGLNTQFQASPEHPEVLFVDDFANSGVPQLVRAYYDGDRLVPRPSRKELAAKIPAVAKRYPKNDDYARATLGEILGDDALAAATRLEVTELRSGVFLSQPGGRFAFRPLPTRAQVAPIQGMVASDFDGDGNSDLLLVHNSYAPGPAVGRFDGGLGLWLRGDGRGGFQSVAAEESGILAPGDVKALAILDFNDDYWPDVFATRNNASALAFSNAGESRRQALAVRLEGRPGNPTAIGSRIGIRFRDGATCWREVRAGGGWASQSTATCYFGYSLDNPPVSAEIRWADGSVESREIAGEAGLLVLRQAK